MKRFVCASVAALTAAPCAQSAFVDNFTHTIPGTVSFSMNNLRDPDAPADPHTVGQRGLTDYVYQQYGMADHLHQNWWWIRHTYQERPAGGGAWMNVGVDMREFALGERNAVPQNENLSADLGTGGGVRMVYDAQVPGAAITQRVSVAYRVQNWGGVLYAYRALRPDFPGGDMMQQRLLTEVFWMVDIDAQGTAGNDFARWNQSGGINYAIFSDNQLETMPVSAGARGMTLRGRLDSRANIVGLLSNAAADDLPAGFARPGGNIQQDWAVLFQWKIEWRERGPFARGDDEPEPGYELVEGDEWEFEVDAVPAPGSIALGVLAGLALLRRRRANG